MNKIKRGLWTIGLIICVCIGMFSAHSLYQYLAEAGQRGQEFADLAEIVENMQDTKTGDENEKEEMQGQGGDESAMLSEYAALYNQNEDMVGWISIEGTDINYPVMHTPENPDFYLKHNFNKEYSDYGVPYVAGKEQDFQEYIEKCQELSLYDIGITAAYGDELLTLSTCEYSSKNGRMVVVGKKIGSVNQIMKKSNPFPLA